MNPRSVHVGQHHTLPTWQRPSQSPFHVANRPIARHPRTELHQTTCGRKKCHLQGNTTVGSVRDRHRHVAEGFERTALVLAVGASEGGLQQALKEVHHHAPIPRSVQIPLLLRLELCGHLLLWRRLFLFRGLGRYRLWRRCRFNTTGGIGIRGDGSLPPREKPKSTGFLLRARSLGGGFSVVFDALPISLGSVVCVRLSTGLSRGVLLSTPENTQEP
mmetsp:Transcript_33309/g.74543  ORF Transcript_33309/g.74543 Transcript_33309/m.74543 type:complete len:217 (-) Transcript_33309:1135-1785(-)